MERRSRLLRFFDDPTFMRGPKWTTSGRSKMVWVVPSNAEDMGQGNVGGINRCPLKVIAPGLFKVKSSLFGGKINFFENVAVRPWVPNVEFLTVLGQGFQTKKTASCPDEE